MVEPGYTLEDALVIALDASLQHGPGRGKHFREYLQKLGFDIVPLSKHEMPKSADSIWGRSDDA